MLNISGIHEGFVLDHIKAGMSLQIYHDLKLDELDCTVAIIKNGALSIAISNDISEALLDRIFQVIRHALRCSRNPQGCTRLRIC